MPRKTHIIVHYSESNTGDIRTFEKYHKETHGWKTVGYNYVIPRDGSIENIIGELAVGIHAPGFNENSIGICVVCTKEQPPTKYQLRTLLYIVNAICGRYGLHPDKILGHKETGRDTDCPGPIDMDWFRQAVKESRETYKKFCYQLDTVI